MKKIIIAGGVGFLGKTLEQYFNGSDYTIKILTRNLTSTNHIFWNGKTMGSWTNELEQADVLINLCGKSVDCRYTAKNREKILHSRIDSTHILQSAINACQQPPKVWLNASSATIYIHAENYVMTEREGLIGDDFFMTICKKWEHECFKQENQDVRKIALRTSIVLGSQGGAFPKMKVISRMGLGGKQGDGRQFMSWIHSYDFCRAIHFIIENIQLSGPINITSPNPVRNTSFMAIMRKSMNIPIGIPAPRALLEAAAAIIGTETELLLKSRNVYPEHLVKAGFEFDFPLINQCMSDLAPDGRRQATEGRGQRIENREQRTQDREILK